MDGILQSLLSLSFVFGSLGIAGVTFVAKHTIEWILDQPWVPASKYSKIWKELVLPILPPVLGAFVCYLATGYPYPEGFNSESARVVFGLVSGLFSGLVYRVLKSALSNKISEKE